MSELDDLYRLLNPWWQGAVFDSGIRRAEYENLTEKSYEYKNVEIIVGGRRTGKTTILKQVIAGLLKKVPATDIFYLQADLSGIDKLPLEKHLRNFRTLFKHPFSRKIYFLVDEIQIVPGWDGELKSIYDLGGVKVYITGSTSYLIESRGNKLTGRQTTTRIMPLSFREFLEFKKYAPYEADTHLYVAYLDEYMASGGYPEVVTGTAEMFYMRKLLEDVISRDIIRLFRVKKDHEVKTVLELISAGLGTRSSYNRLAKPSGITVATAKQYVSFLEKAYLISVMGKWTWSAKDRAYAQKKIYFSDTGFKNALDNRRDIGVRAENTLYNYLSQKAKSIGYFAESTRELDFVTDLGQGPIAVESKYVDELEENDKRLDGLKLYIKRNKPAKAYVATRSYEKDFVMEKTPVTAVPLWKILLGKVSI